MEPELFDKWVAALRSNKFRQTIGALQDTNGYCCLGVLCDVAGLKKAFSESRGKYSFFFENTSCLYELPVNFRDKIKMRPELQSELTCLNDESGYSFDMIANHLENNRTKFVKN